ncbi:hypothetical protein [Natronomonas sp. EA1]|uniref:hypothetical protein n=1 Tax=Natronomonas sp. EA1 TaxID=3421655 RepID=UPI003EB9271B
MRALHILAIALLCLAVGCLGGPAGPAGPGTTDPGGNGSASPTPLPVTFETPTGECTAVTPTPAGNDEVASYAYPSPPETWSRNATASYVESFERAYLHAEKVDARTTYIEVYVSDVRVTRHGNVSVVRLSSYTNGGYENDDADTGTPIEVHWDGAEKPVAYLVTDERIVRTEGGYQRTPALADLGNGRTVACR